MLRTHSMSQEPLQEALLGGSGADAGCSTAQTEVAFSRCVNSRNFWRLLLWQLSDDPPDRGTSKRVEEPVGDEPVKTNELCCTCSWRDALRHTRAAACAIIQKSSMSANLQVRMRLHACARAHVQVCSGRRLACRPAVRELSGHVAVGICHR